jgi:hypothetical protein
MSRNRGGCDMVGLGWLDRGRLAMFRWKGGQGASTLERAIKEDSVGCDYLKLSPGTSHGREKKSVGDGRLVAEVGGFGRDVAMNHWRRWRSG